MSKHEWSKDAQIAALDVRIAELERRVCYWRDKALELHKELAAARKECEEQARLNGMGSEREAALCAEIDRMRGLLKRARVPIGHDDLPMLQPCPHCDKPIEVGTDQRARKSAFFDASNKS